MAENWHKINDIRDLASSIREKRRGLGATQSELAGIAGVGLRFVSEVENGKETAEIGKVLHLLRRVGLELWVAPRGQEPHADDAE